MPATWPLIPVPFEIGRMAIMNLLGRWRNKIMKVFTRFYGN